MFLVMTSTEVWREWQGRVVAGKFPLREWLGGSERSAIFLTEWRQPPLQAAQKAAIKLIAADAGAERQLSRWRIAAQLSHPHLIRIFEAGRCQMNGTPLLYVVMEYAEEDLSQILPQRPLTPDEAADLLPPLLDALSYLHGKGFVHGNIKPSNVLAVGDQLKLSADEVTSAAERDSRQWRGAYDAPETASGMVSPAGDLWSLGLTLVAALTQNAPSGKEAQIPPSLGTLPEPFRGIARECLRLDPKQRCSVAQIQARLEPAARSVPAGPEAPPPLVRHYRYTWRMLIPVVVLLAFGLGAYLFHRIFSGKGARSGEYRIETAHQGSQTQGSGAALPQPTGINVQGEVVREVLPDVPKSATDTITGTIKISVQVEVDSWGKVTAAKLVTRGPSQYFADHTLKAAQSWEFSPPEVNGRPATSVWVLRFRLRRTSIQASAERVRH
jgi:TonB family protein